MNSNDINNADMSNNEHVNAGPTEVPTHAPTEAPTGIPPEQAAEDKVAAENASESTYPEGDERNKLSQPQVPTTSEVAAA